MQTLARGFTDGQPSSYRGNCGRGLNLTVPSPDGHKGAPKPQEIRKAKGEGSQAPPALGFLFLQPSTQPLYTGVRAGTLVVSRRPAH